MVQELIGKRFEDQKKKPQNSHQKLINMFKKRINTEKVVVKRVFHFKIKNIFFIFKTRYHGKH